MPQRLFITGTDTDAGKTFITLELLRLLRSGGASVRVFKPVCTGVDGVSKSDVETLSAASGQSAEETCALSLSRPMSPVSAAQAEGGIVSLSLLDAAFKAICAEPADYLLVEGAGGLLCPLNETLTMRDLALRWSLPVVIVASLKLGAINHTLLTCEAAEAKGLDWSVILCEPQPTDPEVANSTVRELSARLGKKIVGYAPHGRCLLKFEPETPTIADAGQELPHRKMTADDVAELF